MSTKTNEEELNKLHKKIAKIWQLVFESLLKLLRVEPKKTGIINGQRTIKQKDQ